MKVHNLKKIFVIAAAILAFVIVGAFMINRKADKSSQYYEIAETDNGLNGESGTCRPAESNEIASKENPAEFVDASNDLVYREYSWGCGLERGDNILIEKDKVNEEVEDVQGIVVLSDNGVHKEFDCKDSDIEFTVEKSGNYAFLAIDSNGNFVDIMSMIGICKPANGGVMPLERVAPEG